MPPLVTFDRATLGYGRRVVLTDITFDIPEGDFLGLVGPNGAGKTTILRALLGTLAPLSGTVLNSLSSDATFVGEPYRYEQVSHPRPGGGRDDLEPTSPRRRRRQRDRDDEGDPDAEWESLPLPPPNARN